MRSNPIRFTGMASGMDTDSIVKDMMRPQQYKVDQEKKAQALVKLKQDAWKEMNKKLYDFHTKSTHKMSLKSTYTAKVTTTSNPGAIEINNGAVVPEGTHNIEITSLAKSTSVTGKIQTVMLGTDAELGPNTTVKELTGSEAKEIHLVMTVNKEEVTVAIGSADTLRQVADKMNKGLKDTGFTARYDAANGRFFVSSTKTGAGQEITFDSALEIEIPYKPAVPAVPGVDGKPDTPEVPEQPLVPSKPSWVFGRLGLGTPENTVEGKDAVYTYNEVKFESASNQIEINGIQATLKAQTTQPITIFSAQDPDATYDFIKEFVTEYNDLIEELNLKIGTKPGKDIMPLTAEERDSMSDSEIKLWEEKLNSSLFYKDPQITEFLDNARSILSRQFGGDLAALGIVSGPWTERGKLHILGDKDDDLYAEKPNKLREALSENAQAVADKFYEIGQSLYTKTNEKLIKGSQLRSAMNFYNDKAMDTKFKTHDKQIAALEERMYKMEDIQYAKFAAMEKMLSTLNNQSSWLSQQFGGM